MAQRRFNGYVGAPYNFVGLSERVYKKDKLQPHNVIEKEKLSGTITYEIKAETPIFIGADEENFYKNCYGQYAIPGSTVRGLVRSNVQILSCSSIKDDIQDGYLMYRHVGSGIYKEPYKKVLGDFPVPVKLSNGKETNMSVLKNVKAGYIRNLGDEYVIIQTAVDSLGGKFGAMNYYVLSERKIIENGYKGFEYLKEIELQHCDGKFTAEKGRDGRTHYKGNKNENYVPYNIPVSYKLNGSKVTAIDKPGKLMKKGYLVSSGFMEEKKAFYLIPEIDEKKEFIEIPDTDIDNFRRDYENRKNQVEVVSKTFFNLPEKGETKPVFYINLEKLYFGFTPRLRVFYKQKISAGLKGEQSTDCIDYSKSLFGYIHDDDSYKTRLSFMDAPMTQKSKNLGDRMLILSGPKPNSYLDYLEATEGDGIVSYNDNFQLRGVKQYWLKKVPAPCEIGKNKNVAAHIYPFDRGAVFEGKIKFSNLTEEELGMVIWGLRLEENSQQNVGKGKPYGYGRISVTVKDLQILDNEALYNSDSLCLQPYKSEKNVKKYQEYIALAKVDMTRFIGSDIMEVPQIQDFLLMKEADKIPSNDRTRYMALDGNKKGEKKDFSKKEYQQRMAKMIRLPSVKDVVDGKLIMYEEAENKGNQKGNYKKNNNNSKKNPLGNYKNSTGSVNTMGDLFKGIKLD